MLHSPADVLKLGKGWHWGKLEEDAMDMEDLPKPKHEHVLGENLETTSVDELKFRIASLEREITRIQAEISKKQASKDAAAAFFKS